MALLEQECKYDHVDTAKLAKELRGLPVTERGLIAAVFKAKFNAPREKRTWKFEWIMSDICTDKHKLTVYKLVTGAQKRDVVSMGMSKMVPQADSEAALWGWLKKQAR
eukprot:8874794-Pyramimonas_sp.AAC.1